MIYKQRDVVKVPAPLPSGEIEVHPFLILSCKLASSRENYYTGVMMTSSKHTDQFSFYLEDNMFERPLDRSNCQLRLYIIVSFPEHQIKGILTIMHKMK